MTKYPKIQRVLDRSAEMGEQDSFTSYAPFMNDLATELRALLAERDALAAKVPQPVRKLREYKGVTYADGNWRNSAGSWASVSQLIAWVANSSSPRLTDADHAAIYALREQPYETVREDRQVIRDELPPVLPADAVAAEGVRDA